MDRDAIGRAARRATAVIESFPLSAVTYQLGFQARSAARCRVLFGANHPRFVWCVEQMRYTARVARSFLIRRPALLAGGR